MKTQFDKRTVQKIFRVLWKNKIHGWAIRNKPFIKQKHKLLRMYFAHGHFIRIKQSGVRRRNKNKFIWIWWDVTVWRKPNEQLKKYIKATIKNDSGGDLLWGDKWSTGLDNIRFIEANLKQHMNFNILREHLMPISEKFGIKGTFYHDNNSKHTSYRVCQSVLKNHVIKPPVQIPDLHAIENSWT